MASETPSISLRKQTGVIQIGSKLIKTSGGSLLIYRGKKMKNEEEEKIFENSSIRFLIPIEDSKKVENEETSFFLAIADRRLALFRLRDEGTCGAKFKFDHEIIEHGKITEVSMGKVEKKKIFRVRLTIPLVFRVDGMRKVEFTIDYDMEEKTTPIALPLIEKFDKKDGELKVFTQLNEATNHPQVDSQNDVNEEEMEDQKGGKKKRKSTDEESESESMKKKPRGKCNKWTYLECPECPPDEYRTLSPLAWRTHLRRNHQTTPYLAGLALLCECGNESLGEKHSQVCILSEVRVIKKREGPILRLNDKKTTPQCVICKFFPSTPYAYAFHLNRHHKSALKDNGIYLICSCGQKVIYLESGPVHMNRVCDGRQFSLHKLKEV